MEQKQEITRRLETLTAARTAHAEKMKAYNTICADISRCEQERSAAITAGKEAESTWRARFRSLRGNLTEELKAEHSQRIASRELAEEFAGLIEVLELDRQKSMLGCCATGKDYVEAHRSAFDAYAEEAWQSALRCISPKLLHAARLKMLSMALHRNGSGDEGEKPEVTVARLVGETLGTMAERVADKALLETPELALMGLYRPALTGVDMKMYNSPAGRMVAAKEIKAQQDKLAQEI